MNGTIMQDTYKMGCTLETVGEVDGKPLWQLSAFGWQGFIRPRRLEFIAVLQQDA